jgi:hypothetical protein
MRLTIRVKGKFYYDIGLRGSSTLSKKHRVFGEMQPRYLEDFIEKYGKKNIKIISYGDLNNRKDDIKRIMGL